MRFNTRHLLLAWLSSSAFFLLTTSLLVADEVAVSSAGVEFFEKKIRPLLVKHCYECHNTKVGADEVGGSLLLDSREGIEQGGESGVAIVPGNPGKSRLLRAVKYVDPLLQMPPEEKLSDREIADLTTWIAMGAPDPRDGTTPDKAPMAADNLNDDAREWWSFQPVRDPNVLAVQNESWPQNELDHFVLAKLEEEGMSPAPASGRRTRIRRVTYDLTGLPPTREEMDHWLKDTSATAWTTVIDRLLDSPHYGERWGRHWLDVVRYADTAGCNSDFPMPQAYRYRNYVIDSFNNDKPYDQFLREQIAGDLLEAADAAQHREQITATGYLAISRRFSSLAEEFHLTLDDTIDNLGKAVLGLTVSCARCHAHKFDPIPQEDYYALYGIFESSRFAFPGTEIYRHTQDLTPLVDADTMTELIEPHLDQMAAMDAEIIRIRSKIGDLDTGEEKNELNRQWSQLRKDRDQLIQSLPAYEQAYAVSEANGADTRLHRKGDHESLGDEVPRGFLQVLGGQRVPKSEVGSGRRQLAEWLTEEQNPLTARVFVNRVWQHHFGKGLVGTPDDFGTRGEQPSHPELLDWLTSRFVESDWSVKSLHRLILHSATWQMACVENPEYARRDPDKRLLWSFRRRRLDAEEIRDSVLSICGTLDRSMGGPHPFPPEWKWRYTQHRPFVDDYPTQRRSVYLMQQRIRLQPFLAVFDGADTNMVTGERKPSMTAPQALYTLNNQLMHEQAREFASTLLSEANDDSQRITIAYEAVFGRSPTSSEIEEATSYLQGLQRLLIDAGETARQQQTQSGWASYLRILLSSNEFMFVE